MAKLESCETKTANKIIIGCLSIIAICIVICVTVFCILAWMMFSDQSSFKTGLDKYTYLPDSAHDITVFTNLNISGVVLCDFKIEEKDFKDFGEKQEWKIEEIKQPKELFLALSFHKKNTNDKHQIKNGLYYSKRASNGGGITVAYDRDNGRGYISKSSR